MDARQRPQLPTFYILGGAKCGTTSLYHYLGQHPEVLFSEPKEPTFFEAEFHKGPDYYWRRYFTHWSGERAIGEARVYNLYLPYVPARISKLTPRARLIALVRHPVERAYSLWWHRFALNVESRSFEAAIEENLQRIARGLTFHGEEGARLWKRGLYWRSTGTKIGTYVDGGYYAQQLRRYYDLFPASQIRIVLFDDLIADPAGVCSELWGFLELSDLAELDTSAQNAARTERRTSLARVTQRWAEPLGLGRLLPRALKERVRPLLRGRPIRRPSLRPDTRRLLVAHYRNHNRELEDLLQRDLSHWNE
jgi:hypothetical protein